MTPKPALRTGAARAAAVALLSVPIVLAAAWLPPARAGELLSPAAIDYLASSRFAAVLLASLREQAAPGPRCDGGTRVELRELKALQAIVMDVGPHPESGLWIVRVEAERCGAARSHSIFFSARHGAPPAATPLPEGEVRGLGG